MILQSKFDLGQRVWFMADNKAVEGTVSRVELADMKGYDDGDHESINEYRESYHASYTHPVSLPRPSASRDGQKYFNHTDIGVSVFTSREELLKTI